MNFKFIKLIKLFLLLNILIINIFYYKDYFIVINKTNNNLNITNFKKFNNNFYEFNYLNKINNLKVIDLRYSYSFKYSNEHCYII